MKIAYIGNYHNHGYSVSNIGTTIVFLLSRLSEVEIIDVYCPLKNDSMKETYSSPKIKVNSIYNPNKSCSILNYYKVNWTQYDVVFVNSLSTSFGKSNFTNLFGMLLPLFLKRVKKRNVRLIYHNSTFTNDIRKLGYNSWSDKIRFLSLKMIEICIFRNVDTFLTLKKYVDTIKKNVNNAKVSFADISSFEGISTILLNGLIDRKELIIQKKNNKIKTILLYGYWGPQKNLELALSTLAALRAKGHIFRLILAGGLNSSFPSYKHYFEKLLSDYLPIIDEKIDYVEDEEVFSLFEKSDIVLIPYNSPGGHSSVFETAIFFKNYVVGIDFPEFVEQADHFPCIKLVSPEDFRNALLLALESTINQGRVISIEKHLQAALESMERILNNSCF